MALDPNKQAREELSAERAKLGFPKPGPKNGTNSDELDEDTDMGDLEDDATDAESEEETDVDSEGSDDDESDKDESEDGEEGDEDEDDESDSQNGKKIPKKFLEKEKRKRLKLKEQRDELRSQLASELEEKEKLMAQLPDDLDEKIKVLAEKLKVTDPDNLKEMIKFIKEMGGKDIADLRKQVSTLMDSNQGSIIANTFNSEWSSFKPVLEKDFPGANPEEIAAAQKLMLKLAHTPGVGGRKFTDSDGKEKLDPYPLEYVLFKNRNQFEAIMTKKRVKGMEQGRTQGTTVASNDDASKKLPKNATSAQIRAKERYLASLEEGDSDLRTPENREI